MNNASLVIWRAVPHQKEMPQMGHQRWGCPQPHRLMCWLARRHSVVALVVGPLDTRRLSVPRLHSWLHNGCSPEPRRVLVPPG